MITSDFEGYLSKVKGSDFRGYRKNWNTTGSTQMPGDHPLQLNIELTSYCNLRCKMCHRNFVESKTREYMSMELVDKIVKEAKELHVESIWLGSGSEMLLHPYCVEILRKFAGVEPLDYWVATNGVLLNQEISETLVDIPVTWLTVSLDAATTETYKRIRGGNLDIVERNITEFLNVRERKNSRLPFLRVSFVNMEDNYDELDVFKQKWENLADVIDVQTLVDFSTDVSANDVNQDFVCSNPFRLIYIHYDGEIFPCCNEAYKNCGKRFYLQDMSIKQFWESSFRKELLESLRRRQYMPCCMDCVRMIRK